MGNASTLRIALSHIGDALVSVTLAPLCASCHVPLDSPTHGCVCTSCWAIATATSSILWSSDRIAIARAAGHFDGPLRDIVHALKYEGRRSLARPLAGMMSAAGADVLKDADVIVPVPLHPLRRLRRGFNQASDLARGLHAPIVHALWRVRLTASQSGLSGAERRRNVRDAFVVSPLMSTRTSQRMLRDAVVVLVDDVRTTGATLDACAAALMRIGVREVRALTAAARDLRTSDIRPT